MGDNSYHNEGSFLDIDNKEKKRPDIYKLLEQDKVWCPSNTNGEPVKLKEMTIEHRRNLYRWVLRKAPILKRRLEMDFVVRAILSHNGYEAILHLDRSNALEKMDAEEWARDQPLMVRLRKQLAKHERRIRREWIAQHNKNNTLREITPTFQRHRNSDGDYIGKWSAGRNGHTVQHVRVVLSPSTTSLCRTKAGVYIYPVCTEFARGVELIDENGKTLNKSIELTI